ncbi:MAG: hypothetical protein B0D96_01420 [Candidatus Sedimenticola endophacoides]|uniref:Xcc1710-like domain-containing protein n=1 Tax=Candidatus Sedimenticola endophacoides TaxID=2548426 RepID=A0A657Q5A2_9GAMM|nr:MAG: hypothetical protein B0D94_00390 [Candidatus Sedimenticola endophacoides]OQX37740.1 MAG: hypothetical protein B0D96_01420 [Candidatus Sedimenticola endophacoides]OQX38796.1 MAG: hypothetical protein B0D89_12035 [Candidatus Sedimenticola endophacoides]OQX40694.1 MAG: hypothetical protein B0D82_02910 [Candidatus Sedimenticola endophacoides]OQX43306.1 MAG: hypothetical protein B0D88_04725 [Candidatus Sedimenticola endophacoides]
MKFVMSSGGPGHVISAYHAGEVRIDGRPYTQNLILLPEQILAPWGAREFDALEPDDFAPLLELRPDLVLLGTGARHRFPDPRLYAPLIGHGIALEAMTTAAACRTYNILMGEGRRIAAALFV